MNFSCMSIPKSLQPILWSKQVSLLDKKKDRDYIIHQVLSRGTIAQMHWLMNTYGMKTVRRVFLQHPQRSYSPSALNFSRKFIVGSPRIRSQKYVQAPLRHI